MGSAGATLDSPVTAGAGRTLSPWPAAVALVIAAAAWMLHTTFGWRMGALFGVGTAAGLVLYHAAFGFTSAWRVLIADGRGEGVRAQMLLLALTCAVFFPLLAQGQAFGVPLTGLVQPPGVPVVLGAFIFGIGMQLGGGCASGTLFSAGSGSPRMFVTLAAFVAGSLVATAHSDFWAALPSLPATSLVTRYGPVGALALSLVVFGAISIATVVVERRRFGALVETPLAARGPRWLRGPWPLAAGAVGLALVNLATLLLAGRPWGITSAFALWGAKVARAVGVPVETWPYWSTPAQLATLDASVFGDVTSVMDGGIMLGALLAALLAGRFSPVWSIPARSLAAAVGGGLLLGYGARIAYGCNIGAFYSGIASGSLHGWLWLPCAFAGNVIGTWLRPAFGLSVERTTLPRC
ncbi:MAG: YeeE/YedE family protein [Acidobacteria bacterium]|nr:YeeE/YedE family protein [Acidobacteriota bacterium]